MSYISNALQHHFFHSTTGVKPAVNVHIVDTIGRYLNMSISFSRKCPRVYESFGFTTDGTAPAESNNDSIELMSCVGRRLLCVGYVVFGKH